MLKSSRKLECEDGRQTARSETKELNSHFGTASLSLVQLQETEDYAWDSKMQFIMQLQFITSTVWRLRRCFIFHAVTLQTGWMACLLAPSSEGQPVEIKYLSYISINHCCIQEPCHVNLVDSLWFFKGSSDHWPKQTSEMPVELRAEP
jgi:hypothetical protein